MRFNLPDFTEPGVKFLYGIMQVCKVTVKTNFLMAVLVTRIGGIRNSTNTLGEEFIPGIGES